MRGPGVPSPSTQRRLPSLMPAGPAVDQGSHDNRRSVPTDRRCGLVQCRKVECHLRSHRQFAALKRQPSRLRRKGPLQLAEATLRRQLSDSVLGALVARVEQRVTDSFPETQFRDETSSIFREMAHHYFGSQIDRLIAIFSPHLDQRKYKSTMIEHALSNDVFCVCIIANAKTDMLMRTHVRIADRASEIVYATTALILRLKLQKVEHRDIDWLLVLVVALVGFDLAFGRTETLKNHHEAMKQLIAAKGGIHRVGHAISYIVNTDRILAIFTGQYPHCRETPFMPTSPTVKQSSVPYGVAFSCTDIKNVIHLPVRKFCMDLCQLLYVMECTHINLSPEASPSSDPSMLPYFLYTRDRLGRDGSWLHADYHEDRNSDETHSVDSTDSDASLTLSKSRCVLLAAMIIEYHVTHANYYTVKGPFLAEQLKSVLEKQPSSEWTEHVDMLLWLLVVAAALPESWTNHDWAVQELSCWLAVKWGDEWQKHRWKNDLLAMLKDYVWTSSLDTAVTNLCTELVNSKQLQ